MIRDYKYPVTKFPEALDVLNPNSQIDVFEKGIYINLDSVRGTNFINQIKRQIGIYQNSAVELNTYAKILLSGHRGSGKSVELQRITHHINGIHFTVHISIEKTLVKLSAVEPEDIYQVIIIELLKMLEIKQIDYDREGFENITNKWIDEKTIENLHIYKTETQLKSKIGFSFSALIIKLQAYLNAVITAQSEDSETVRRKIKSNITEIIKEVNTQLSNLRLKIREHGYYDFLFVLDGTEKLDYDLSKKIFIYDAPILNQINAHFVFASPILQSYDLAAGSPFFQEVSLPMVTIDSKSIDIFKSIITKRVNEDMFFDFGVLECIVIKSGGSIRQLEEIAYKALISSVNYRVDKEALQDALYTMGLTLFRRLSGDHKKILKEANGKYDYGDEKVKEMLFSLILLTKNEATIINPLLEPFISESNKYLCD